tara:strand:- start:597 stop:917 length:321 start_codon:yes stop_codon:yes gene_type:complete
MIKHKKIYKDFFKYAEQDFVPCELCGNQAVDVHHIEARGMGGSKTKDHIVNLMGVCRSCHNKCGANKSFNKKAWDSHLEFMYNYLNGNKEKLEKLVREYVDLQYPD